MKIVHNLIISASLVLILLSTGCDRISGLFNPFTGTWKSGFFTLKFNTDKSFEMKTGIGVTLESEGKYWYDDDYLYLNFSSEHINEFTYEFNDDKTELSLSPKTESLWFKATITFEKNKKE